MQRSLLVSNSLKIYAKAKTESEICTRDPMTQVTVFLAKTSLGTGSITEKKLEIYFLS